MSLNLPKKIWVFAERLYIHSHDVRKFLNLLERNGIEYSNQDYEDFNKPKNLYTFMSEENYTFANFMQSVPTYKYLKVLEIIIFDSNVINTKEDNWNYYGEYIKNWYPTLTELLELSGVKINHEQKKLVYREEEHVTGEDDFLAYSFNDPFLDYLRKEINESYQRDLYSSVMFLSRKVLEIIFVRILEVVFPKLVNGKYCKTNHELWYDTSRNGYRNFGELIDKIKDNAEKFHEDRQLILNLCAFVKPFKNETNACVHDDYKIPDAGYIRDWRVAYIVNMARKVFRKYCNP